MMIEYRWESHEGRLLHTLRQQWQTPDNDQEDSTIDAQSSYWIDADVIGDGGKPATTIPLNSGYFDMVMPKAFFEGNPKSFTVNWIEFYR